MPRKVPKTAEELTTERANLPDAMSEKQLQRVSVGRLRYALSQLAQNNVQHVQDWLVAIEIADGPKAAMELYLKMIEYSVPKLSRTEVKVEDSAGNALVTELSMDVLQDMVRNFVKEESRTVESTAEDVTQNSD